MTWAKVDDKLHSSVKWRRASRTARGLWITALSWCADQANGGRVPADMLRMLDGKPADAASLVAAGLWDEVDGGWEFHDWADYNPDAASVKAKREAESDGGKRGNHQRWHVNKKVRVPDCEWCYPESGTRSGPDQGGESGANPPGPARPGPTRIPMAEVVLQAEVGKRANAQQPAGSPHAILAGHGLDDTQRAAFLAHLAANGIKRPSAFVSRLHQRGELRDRLNEWHTDTTAEARARSQPPPGKRTTDDRVRDGIALARRLAAEDAHPHDLPQIGA